MRVGGGNTRKEFRREKRAKWQKVTITAITFKLKGIILKTLF